MDLVGSRSPQGSQDGKNKLLDSKDFRGHRVQKPLHLQERLHTTPPSQIGWG